MQSSKEFRYCVHTLPASFIFYVVIHSFNHLYLFLILCVLLLVFLFLILFLLLSLLLLLLMHSFSCRRDLR